MKRIFIKLSDDEHAAIKRMAFDARITLSNYVRRLMGITERNWTVQQGKRSAAKAGRKAE